ncbi:response regulator [Massilia sp. CF038]|uniref:response regulator n=1 Tax=Massilia sp. CF038 TaxID=1881045 RepID=UPI00091B19BD|nr:response regulator [Massilia sp. CF038]SHH08743.1 Response regulator receiver domain-containing protein [Massilia sp. CF038]
MSNFKTSNLAALGAQPALSANRPSVMIVDDMDANVSVMATILRPHFHVIEAGNGPEALALAEAIRAPQALACIISDHRMPRMSGVQLFERMQRLLPDARRILVTGYLDIDAIIDAINKGKIYHFVAKPFDAPEFLLTVRCAAASFKADVQRQAWHTALADLHSAPPPALAALQRQADDADSELAALEAQLLALRSSEAA